jgi:hypothetical protein
MQIPSVQAPVSNVSTQVSAETWPITVCTLCRRPQQSKAQRLWVCRVLVCKRQRTVCCMPMHDTQDCTIIEHIDIATDKQKQ